MPKRIKIDLAKEIPLCFERIWQYKQEQRAAGNDFQGATYYVTATDLEDEVRNKLAGGEPGQRRGGWMSNLRISTGSRLSLLDVCRKYLLSEVSHDRLDSHNFGRGHISGERFRPHGSPLSPAEEKSFAQKAKAPKYEDKPIHFADPKTRYPAKSLCSRKARETARAKSPNYYRGPSKSQTRTTKEPNAVTCPRCAKLLRETSEKLLETSVDAPISEPQDENFSYNDYQPE